MACPKSFINSARYLVAYGLMLALGAFALGVGCAIHTLARKPNNATGALANSPAVRGEYYQISVPDTLDLAERARLGVHHLTSIIRPEKDFEMWNSGWFHTNNQPIANYWFGSLTACQMKCMEALAMEQVVCGSAEGQERQAGALAMLAGCLGEEGLFWTLPSGGKKPWLGPEEARPYANIHGQGDVLRMMMAYYQTTGDPAWKARIDRLVDGLDQLMVFHKGDYAYIPLKGWMNEPYLDNCFIKGKGWKDLSEPANEKGGEEGSLFNNQGHIPGTLANWYLLTGNRQALRLAGELIRFLMQPKFWADFQDGEYPAVIGAQHAHWMGHAAGHPNTLRSILEYGIATNDPKLKEFARDGYEWVRQTYISRIGYVGDGQGCILARWIALAIKLSDAGVGDYWEDVDLYIRNHAVEYQLTPEDIPWLKARGQGKPDPNTNIASTLDGVLDASLGAIADTPFKEAWAVCCSSHGNMGYFYAWDGALRYSRDNSSVRINLLLNRASPWMDVDSYLPYEGKVVLKNKSAREAFVRLPLWVELSSVKCRVGRRAARLDWFGRYLRVGGLKPGDMVTIEFPVVERVEQWTAPGTLRNDLPKYPGNVTYTLKFKGNTLVGLTPELLPGCPLYTGRTEKYKAAQAPMRQVQRFVTPFFLKW